MSLKPSFNVVPIAATCLSALNCKADLTQVNSVVHLVSLRLEREDDRHRVPTCGWRKESIFKHHLIPRLGRRRLDHITDEDIQRLKAALIDRAPKTVNKVLTVLSNVLRVAVKWKLISQMP
jgi:hypothetical protein